MTFCVTDPDLALILASDGAHPDDGATPLVMPFLAAGLLLASVLMLLLA